MVSNFEVNPPKETPTPNNIGGGLKGHKRQLRKEDLFVQYDKRKLSALFRIPSQSNPSLKEQNPSVCSLLQVLGKVTVLVSIKFSRHGSNMSSQIKYIDYDK